MKMLSITETSSARRLYRLLVRVRDQLLVIPTGEIDWVGSAGNYAVLHVGRDNHVLRETLLQLEARLDPNEFMRVSRTAIVNLRRVRALQHQDDGRYEMILADGTQLPISRGIREVQARLETGA